MVELTTPKLFAKLHPVCKNALNAAIALTQSRTNYNLEIEHWLLKLVETSDSDVALILKRYAIDSGRVVKELTRALDKMKTGNGRMPNLSPDLIDVVRDAWLLTSVEHTRPRVRSGMILLALLQDRVQSIRVKEASSELARIPLSDLQENILSITQNSAEAPPLPEDAAAGAGAVETDGTGQDGVAPKKDSKTPNLDRFCQDLTERAAAGKIDPVIGRDVEVEQVIDILTRRRQNNPIIVGEAGVGKTAVVEGFALRVVAKDVPDALKNVSVRALDLGLLQAGAGVKGEFENRLKAVITEIQQSPTPVILFIDEAHTLMGAGAPQGSGDAANLLKPALARGELRTIAATTFAEYKKSFETDPAMKRRFQPVTVEEPDRDMCVAMLRGLVGTLERHHKVRVLDDAMEEAVRLSQRYITDRQLPDKAISVLDTACARVGLSQSSTPPAIEECKFLISRITTEIEIREREAALGISHSDVLAELNIRKKAQEEKLLELEKRLETERKIVADIRERAEKIENDLFPPKPTPDTPPPTPLTDAERKFLREEIQSLTAKLREVQGETPLVHPQVTGQVVAEVVARWTGVPIGKMVRNEIEAVRTLAERMQQRVIGQDHAMQIIAKRVQAARAGLTDPRRPIGVFMLCGTSGVGKTETAITLAELLFGGDRGLITINMSEYKEDHKISRLTGAAAGYVGYGEGGVLTEAVRRKPNSIVLLDEVEKAAEAVQEIFYQVFDKGVLQDDKGQNINFKNTIILLTSNVGTETIMGMTAKGTRQVDMAALEQALRPELLKKFKPALLGRLEVVPYFPLGDEILKKIVALQLGRVASRIRDTYKAEFVYDDAVVDLILSRCKQVETGARTIDHLITGTLLPDLAQLFLGRMVDGRAVEKAIVTVNPEGGFSCELTP